MRIEEVGRSVSLGRPKQYGETSLSPSVCLYLSIFIPIPPSLHPSLPPSLPPSIPPSLHPYLSPHAHTHEHTRPPASLLPNDHVTAGRAAS